MTRWLLLAATILGFLLVFTTRSHVLLGIGLLLGIGGFLGFVFSLAAERISANARPDTAMASPAELAAMRKPTPRPQAVARAQSPATQRPAATAQQGSDPSRSPSAPT